VFITAVPIIKLFAGGRGSGIVENMCHSGGHVATTRSRYRDLLIWMKLLIRYTKNSNSHTDMGSCATWAVKKRKIERVECGENHAIALTDEGSLVVWGVPCAAHKPGCSNSPRRVTAPHSRLVAGVGNGGQLGLGAREHKLSPVPLTGLEVS